MSSDTPLVGIDVGSSSVRVVVAEAEPHRLVVKGCGEARHDGARKGVIATLEEVSSAVRDAAEEAEAMASFPVEVGIVGLAGLPIQGCRPRPRCR
jgi:cell division protein FtsA